MSEPLLERQVILAVQQAARPGNQGFVEAHIYASAVREIMAATNKPLFTIYVDLAKTFDRVPHSLVTLLVNHLFGDGAMEARCVNEAINFSCSCIVTSRDLCTAVPFQFDAGVPQVDQTSPLLNNLAMSPISPPIEKLFPLKCGRASYPICNHVAYMDDDREPSECN
ncbi:hypothetical protein RF11_00368 [Thelohanellus kitauei]|uniref:Reverse transcriptase domain-containing protein n=1 Tax=Thelohanellus kitauei TaxID=669202 RepID=A0A0C2NAY7_THEKT|nr:hypothetical protein RF11_00368 [Thelohanellus kitauei]